MTLESECASLELSRRWKEIGGMQDTVFEWVEDDGEIYLDYTMGRGVAAPMVGELMEWIRKEIGIIWPASTIDLWTVEERFDKVFQDKSLANALMQMAIWLEKEKGK